MPQLRMGHRRLASVVDRPLPDGYALSVDAAAHSAVVSVPGGRVVATVALTWRDATSVEVVRIHVDAEHRGRGVATAALAAVLQPAHGSGAEYAVAYVAPDDGDAARSLRRCGFEPELTRAGDEAAWEALLEHETGSSDLL